ncbi:hypothetical protein [Marinomonas ostreistagni]|uniref:hypothetical protein n=1 Tax=Marinomonas ostreistagni TaxID=359209 RepID=UPI00194EDDFC|nr:hypothetical protein [Marinomonas ostreistagni]MBM6550915.1 hypothetical protein [Marinomonas ostreistagni]
MRKDVKGSVFALTLALALSGCASTGGGSAGSLMDDAARSELIIQINSVKQAIDAAQQRLAKAQEQELDWYATDDFNDAQDALEDAQSYYREYQSNPAEANDKTGFFSSTTNLEATEQNLERFSSKMDSADATRTLANSTLADAFSNRDYLKKIDAQQHFPSLSNALDKELKKLVDLVADDRPDQALADQAALLAKQHTLEVKTITKVYLTDAQQAFQTLNNSNAKQLAPNAFAKASATLTDALAFVASSPKQLEQVQEKARLSVFFTQRAELIADEVEKLRALQQRPLDHEGYILRIEALLYPLQQSLGAVDGRDQTFEAQTQALVRFINDSQQSSENAAAQLQQLNNTVQEKDAYIKSLREELERLRPAEQTSPAATQDATSSEAPAAATQTSNSSQAQPSESAQQADNSAS